MWVNIHNRSNKETIATTNRRSGLHYLIAPRQSHAFARDVVTVFDEIELTVQIAGLEGFDINVTTPGALQHR